MTGFADCPDPFTFFKVEFVISADLPLAVSCRPHGLQGVRSERIVTLMKQGSYAHGTQARAGKNVEGSTFGRNITLVLDY